jgi:hypothetical protein
MRLPATGSSDERPDQPHESVTLMRVRARITDPAPGARPLPAGTYTVRGKAWSGTGPVTNVDLSFTGEGEWRAAKRESPEVPINGRTGRSSGRRPKSDGTHCAHAQPTPPATFNQMSHPEIGSATETTRSRCPTSMCADAGSRDRRAEVVKGGQGRC